MMGLTMNERRTITRETARLYQKTSRKQKTKILDNFLDVTGLSQEVYNDTACKLGEGAYTKR